MRALIYVLIAFLSLLVLFFVQAWTGLHVIWLFGVILSYPAIWLLWYTIRMIAITVLGKKTMGKVVAVKGRGDDIIKVKYRDTAGNECESEERAVFGVLKRNHPPEHVEVYYFRRWMNFGWRTIIYWLALDIIWLPLTIACWIGFTGWLV
ncbi:MAG: hypothetical protein IJ265_05035 [Oscillospiraceae bacterium]|nr:hypothetical protein [Oscillospiraceae bacterium]